MENFNYLIQNRQYNNKEWSELQMALMEIVKSFPDEYKMGNINEQEKTVEIKIIKVPFEDGLNVYIQCKPDNKNISVDFKINDTSLPEIKKQEAEKLGKELASNIYYSFSGTLHLSAKAGPLKEKREAQLNSGSSAFSFIFFIITLVILFFSIKTCSSI